MPVRSFFELLEFTTQKAFALVAILATAMGIKNESAIGVCGVGLLISALVAQTLKRDIPNGGESAVKYALIILLKNIGLLLLLLMLFRAYRFFFEAHWYESKYDAFVAYLVISQAASLCIMIFGIGLSKWEESMIPNEITNIIHDRLYSGQTYRQNVSYEVTPEKSKNRLIADVKMSYTEFNPGGKSEVTDFTMLLEDWQELLKIDLQVQGQEIDVRRSRGGASASIIIPAQSKVDVVAIFKIKYSSTDREVFTSIRPANQMEITIAEADGLYLHPIFMYTQKPTIKKRQGSRVFIFSNGVLQNEGLLLDWKPSA